MFAIAWNNGSHSKSGVGYGLKIDVKDRDKYFQRDWKEIVLKLQGHPSPVLVSIDQETFWGKRCRELHSQEVGAWLIKNDMAPWSASNPPLVRLEPISENKFSVNL